MERKLASVARIVSIEPIEGADMIVKATVKGWSLVTQKSNDFKPGDLVTYFEIDSFLPVREEFEFLRKSSYKKMTDGSEGFRLKTIRLRGTISQGLILPLQEIAKMLPEGTVLEEDTDLTELLGITKWDPALPVELSGTAKGRFPSFIYKTDEERAENMLGTLKKLEGTSCYVTSKIDGSSFTAFTNQSEFGVCSRNLELCESEGSSYWKTAKALNLEEKMKSLNRNIALQGELYGNGIQGNKLKLDGLKIAFFNAFDIDKAEYLELDEFLSILDKLELESVPILDRDFKLVSDISVLREKSSHKYASGMLAEGIVIRSNEKIKNERLSFKVINPEFLVNDK